MLRIFLLLLFHSLLAIQAFPVFTFDGTFDSSKTTRSFASLVGDIDFPDTFVLCSSTKQAMFKSVGFFSISGDDSIEWLTVIFQKHSNKISQTIRLTLRWGGKFHLLGELEDPKLDFWYHVCVKVDLSKKDIEVAVNGLSLGRAVDMDIANIPSKLAMSIGISKNGKQFFGSVANVQMFKDGNITDMSSGPCQLRESPLLTWKPTDWEVVGSEWLLTEESEEIFCAPYDRYNLAISTKITISESMDLCQQKLNNSIIPFPDDYEAFLKYVAWHKNTTGSSCPYIWTPLTDQNSEGVFFNMNNNSEAEFQIWNKIEPNGGRDENFVMINVAQGVLNDVDKTRLFCSSCLLSSSLLVQLDGLCEDSIIGDNSQTP